MGYKLLDGKKLADDIFLGLRRKIKEKMINARLAVIIIGNNPSSKLYVKIKKQKCEEVGIKFELIEFEENTSEKALIRKIIELNSNKETTGILIQLPLPDNINTNKILNTILLEKDVDGLTDAAMKKLENGDEISVCCTPKGIIRLLEQNIELNHKKIVLVGQGRLVGKPLSLMLKNRNLEFTACDDKTNNLKSETRKADILISATGVPHLIKKDYIKDGVIIVDAGTAELNHKIVGDVDFDDVKNKTSFITPVPGGVGPMTVAMLMENIVNMSSKKG